jgi:biopolymer transport protein TolR
MTPYRIQRHRKREHHGSHMALVPFIDMLMILVVYLLVHNSDVETLSNTKNVTIPLSVSDKKPRESVVVTITKDEVLVDGQVIVTTAAVIRSQSAVIQSLKTELVAQAAKALTTAQQSIADREVTIMGDRTVPYEVLKKVMATCTDADYGKVSLAVMEREGQASSANRAPPRA